jgi:hypothetical protein
VVRRLFEVNLEPHTGARPSVRLCVGLTTPFSRLGYTRARHLLRFSAPPALFLPLAPRLQAASSRKIFHMQAGQCGNQAGPDNRKKDLTTNDHFSPGIGIEMGVCRGQKWRALLFWYVAAYCA